MAIQAWDGLPGASFWNRFNGAWRESLQELLKAGPPRDAAGAEASLRDALDAQSWPVMGRVHPSWWVRALRDESPAVRRAVAEHAELELQTILRDVLGPERPGTQPVVRPDPDALRWALALWDERILRDRARWPDDTPVILALTELDFWEIVALLRAAGLAKHALTAMRRPRRLSTWSRDRFDSFQRHWLAADAINLDEAARHFRLVQQGWPRKHGWARIGLVTFGRLLARVEPYRARWALQHLPYAVARRLRPAIKDLGPVDAMWESDILLVAWEHLAELGQIRSLEGLVREH
jgi:hypothetical protein